MKISQILTLFFGILIISCNETAKEKAASSAEKEQIPSEQLSGWKLDIELNDGSTWQANKETSEGIENMSSLLDSSAPASLEDYRSLGQKLDSEMQLLINRCTMKGPAHNNLHIYLQPLMGKIGELQEVNSSEKAELLIAEIRKHLEAYHKYFS